MSKTIVVNLFGQPGAGKSSGAAYIFAKLKMMGIDAELVTEFNKDNQYYIFGKQSFKLSRCNDKVDVIITDSPLPLSIIYSKNQTTLTYLHFKEFVLSAFNDFNNRNYFLQRVKPYNPNGRFQTEAESNALGELIEDMLIDNDIDFEYANGNKEGYDGIIRDIVNILACIKGGDCYYKI